MRGLCGLCSSVWPRCAWVGPRRQLWWSDPVTLGCHGLHRPCPGTVWPQPGGGHISGQGRLRRARCGRWVLSAPRLWLTVPPWVELSAQARLCLLCQQVEAARLCTPPFWRPMPTAHRPCSARWPWSGSCSDVALVQMFETTGAWCLQGSSEAGVGAGRGGEGREWCPYVLLRGSAVLRMCDGCPVCAHEWRFPPPPLCGGSTRLAVAGHHCTTS